jgi:hypothetical protein
MITTLVFTRSYLTTLLHCGARSEVRRIVFSLRRAGQGSWSIGDANVVVWPSDLLLSHVPGSGSAGSEAVTELREVCCKDGTRRRQRACLVNRVKRKKDAWNPSIEEVPLSRDSPRD